MQFSVLLRLEKQSKEVQMWWWRRDTVGTEREEECVRLMMQRSCELTTSPVVILTCPFCQQYTWTHTNSHLHTTLLTQKHTTSHSEVRSSLSESGPTEEQTADYCGRMTNRTNTHRASSFTCTQKMFPNRISVNNRCTPVVQTGGGELRDISCSRRVC